MADHEKLEPALAFLRELWALDHALGSTSKRMFDRIGITAPQRMVLRFVGKYPGISATELANPDFAKLAEAYGGWAERVETTEQFAAALARAMERSGIRLLHCVTDVEVITNQTTISALHAR